MRHVLILAGWLALQVCGTAARAFDLGLHTYPLSPSMIEPGLANLDATNLLGDRVKVSVTGKEPYDSFFLSAARLHGATALADTLIGQFGADLKAASKGTMDVTRANVSEWPDMVSNLLASNEADPGEVQRLQVSASNLEHVLPLLASIGRRVPELVTEGSQLTVSAQHDFSGWTEKAKLLGVANGLRVSVGQIKDASANSIGIIKTATPLVEAMHRPSSAQASHGGAGPLDASAPPDRAPENSPPEPIAATTSSLELPWFWRIDRVTEGELLLGAGANAGLTPGKSLVVIAVRDTVRDSETGQPISLATMEIGHAQVTEVQQTRAVAKSVDGCDGVRPGDLVRLEPRVAPGGETGSRKK